MTSCFKKNQDMIKNILFFVILFQTAFVSQGQTRLYWDDFSGVEPCGSNALDFPDYVDQEGFMFSRFSEEDFYTSEHRISIPITGDFWEEAVGSEVLQAGEFVFSLGITHSESAEESEAFWIHIVPNENYGYFSHYGEILGEFEVFYGDSIRLYLIPNGYGNQLLTYLSIDSRYDEDQHDAESEERLFAESIELDIHRVRLIFKATTSEDLFEDLSSHGFSTALCDWFDRIEQNVNTFNKSEFKNFEFRSYTSQEFDSPVWVEEDPIESEPPPPSPNYCNSGFTISSQHSGMTKSFSSVLMGSQYQYAWTFGDGTTSTSPSPQHTFSVEGHYVVTLTLTNTSNGCISNSTSKLVYASVPPPPCSTPVIQGNSPAFSVEDNSKNYSKTISFDEVENVFNSAIIYKDELGRAHQTIEYTEGADYSHANQTIYDEFGRPALSTKTAPVNQGGLGFINDFITDSNGGAFNWQDLNTTDPSVGFNGALGQYYSNGSIEDNVAQTSRPYSQTQYLNQPGASAYKSARPGDSFGLSSSKLSTTSFSLKAGSELDYMYGYFGSYLEDDSGQPIRSDNKDVVKSISTDEDGNTYVAFTSASGLQIASCRSGISGSTEQVSATFLEPGQSQLIHTPFSNKSVKIYFQSRHGWVIGQSDTKFSIYDAITGQDLSAQLTESWNTSGNNLNVTITGSFPEFIRVSVDYVPDAIARYKRLNVNSLPMIEVRCELDYTDWTFNYYNLQGQLTKSIAPKGVNTSFSADPANSNDIVRRNLISASAAQANNPFWTESLNGIQSSNDVLVQLKLKSQVTPTGDPSDSPGNVSTEAAVQSSGSQKYYDGAFSDIPVEPGQPRLNIPQFPTNPGSISNVYRKTILSEIEVLIKAGNTNLETVTLSKSTSYTVVIWSDAQGNTRTTTTDYDFFSSPALIQSTLSSSFNDISFHYVSGSKSTTYSNPAYCGLSFGYTGGTSNLPSNTLISSITTADFEVSIDLQINTASGSGDARTGFYITRYSYDELGRLISIEHPDAGQTRMKYNSLGLLRFVQTAENTQTGLVQYRKYDKNNRLIETGTTSFSWGSLDPDQSYTFTETPLTSRYYYDTYPSSIPLPQDFQTGYDSYYTSGKLTVAKNSHSTRWFGYDYKGRTTWEVASIDQGNGVVTSRGKSYYYDYFDRLVSTNYNPVDQNDVILNNQYDENFPSQLSSITANFNGSAAEIANYQYYQSGQLKRTELIEVNAIATKPYQGVDYLYTVEGWLKSINAPVFSSNSSNDPGGDHPLYNCFQQDLFAMSLDYYAGDYKSSDNVVGGANGFSNGSAGNSYIGNVKAQNWYQSYSTSGIGLNFRQTQSYAYSYDYKNQLTGAVYGTLNNSGGFDPAAGGGHSVSGISYDANGNLQSIQRRDRSGAFLDNLSYTYDSHKNTLASLSDGVSSSSFSQDIETSSATGSMSYNASGQLTYQPYDGNGYSIEYNGLGQVTQVFDGATLIKEYAYGPLGQRVIKRTNPNSSQPETELYFVFSGQIEEVYRNDGSGWASNHYIYGNGRIGVVDRATGVLTYEIQDHLGHVRASFTGSHSGYTVLSSATDYYPFGMAMPERNFSFSSQEHGFQGAYSRRDHDTHWDEFLLRNYDSRIGQFISVDPYLQYASPFVAMGNNPLNVVDPTGGYGYEAMSQDGTAMDPGSFTYFEWEREQRVSMATDMAQDALLERAERSSNWMWLKAEHKALDNLRKKAGETTMLPTIDVVPEKLPDEYTPLGHTVVDVVNDIQKQIEELELFWSYSDDFQESLTSPIYHYIHAGQREFVNEAWNNGGTQALIALTGLGGVIRGGASLTARLGARSIAAKSSSQILGWGKNSTGHLIKHRNVLGLGEVSAQQAQKMLPQLRGAANQLLNNANPALTRVGQWHQHSNAIMRISNGKMLVTQADGTFITVINKTSNNWYNLASPLR